LDEEKTILTKRECEVLSLIAKGYTSQEAADELWIKVKTLYFHLNSSFKKLDAHNRCAAVVKAIGLGLIPPIQ